jgi:NAD(P)-dependent dehydrogenase (short-subunit alcohol dehydrogenase family)
MRRPAHAYRPGQPSRWTSRSEDDAGPLHETAPLPHCVSYIHGLRRRHERPAARDPTEAGGKPLGTQPLAGKTALVTGGSRNIGRAIALRLAGAGADIVVNTLQDRAAAERVAGEIAKGWGRIITLGGISWHTGITRRAHVLAGKAGLTGLTRALAAEFGDRGITANMIAPGSIETVRPASAGTSPPRNPPPVPRQGRVEEIASAALFLAHPAQGYLTGQVIHVNGGAYFGT